MHLALLASLLVAPPAVSDGPYRIDPLIDTTLTLSGAALTLGIETLIGTGELGDAQPGPRKNLIALDRLAVEDLSMGAGTTMHRRISDGVAGTVATWVLLGPLLTMAQDSAVEGAKDFALYSEAVALTLALSEVVKLAARRPRPLTYVTDAPDPPETDRNLSFYSGHTAFVATVGATAATIAFQRDRAGWQSWLTVGLAAALTGWVGTERVLAGKHFPTDVLTGAALGVAMGILVPSLHRE